MKVIKQSYEWMQLPQWPCRHIEYAGRTCYKSEDKMDKESAEKFVKMVLKRGHESVIEHVSASIKFITNRGVTHELVRHRLCAFSQESTRYVNYGGKEIEFIEPVWFEGEDFQAIEAPRLAMLRWIKSLEESELAYNQLLKYDWRPEQAREVLPNSLKTEIVVTANMREWRHIFRLRTSKAAHPQMRALMRDCLKGFQKKIPVLFDDITY